MQSPQFEGFLRLEYGLWHGQTAAELTPVADALALHVRDLVERFPTMLTPGNDLSLRTHEILENTLQFELTGETDMGSNTNLATAWANVQATELSLAPLKPLIVLAGQGSLVPTLCLGLKRLGDAFLAYRHLNGSWAPLQSLSTYQRMELDGETGALLEQLSRVPAILELPIATPADD